MRCLSRLLLVFACTAQAAWGGTTIQSAENRLRMDEGIQLQDYSAPAKSIEEAIEQQKETRSGI
jgi:hypothetical protein